MESVNWLKRPENRNQWFTAAEIAQKAKLPLGTVSSQLSTARQRAWINGNGIFARRNPDLSRAHVYAFCNSKPDDAIPVRKRGLRTGVAKKSESRTLRPSRLVKGIWVDEVTNELFKLVAVELTVQEVEK